MRDDEADRTAAYIGPGWFSDIIVSGRYYRSLSAPLPGGLDAPRVLSAELRRHARGGSGPGRRFGHMGIRALGP